MSKYRAFKDTERRIAHRLGGQRTGHLGGADVVSDWLIVEVKHKKTIPAWIKGAIAQAKRNAQPGKLALVVLHEHGQRSDQDIVLLTLADFQEWFGEP